MENIKSLEKVLQKSRGNFIKYIKYLLNSFGLVLDEEDVMQDVCLSLLNGVDFTAPLENMVGYVFVSIKNRIIDLARKRKGREVELDESLFFSHYDEPDYLAENSALLSRLIEAIDSLPEDQRNVFVLNELEGLKFREISELTKEPVNTLLAKKRYAVLKLKEILKDEIKD